MTGLPTRAQVERIRKQYPKGTKVRLNSMPEDPRPIPAGTVGSVQFVDDIGSVFTNWTNGSGRAFIPGTDSVSIITEEEYVNGGGRT